MAPCYAASEKWLLEPEATLTPTCLLLQLLRCVNDSVISVPLFELFLSPRTDGGAGTSTQGHALPWRGKVVSLDSRAPWCRLLGAGVPRDVLRWGEGSVLVSLSG